MVENLNVNDLPLPPALLTAVGDGRWPAAVPADRLRAVFDDDPVFPRLHPLEAIVSLNRVWRSESDRAYLGTPSAASPPGDIDPRRSLLIGELGPDQLIALDYRTSATDPAVVYLGPEMRSPWRQVAASFAELMDRLEVR